MVMAIPDFLLFVLVGVNSVYLQLFLQKIGYSATQIGLLLCAFNAVGVVISIVLTPALSRCRKLALVLMGFAAAMALLPVPLFRLPVFGWTLIILSLYGFFYKAIIPVADSLINYYLGAEREKYGTIRVFGSIGFVAMCLFMQKFISIEKCTPGVMTAWMSIPAILVALSVIPFAGMSMSDGMNQEKAAPFRETLKSFDKEYYLILFVIFMQYMGMVPPNNFLSLYVKDYLHSGRLGIIWAFCSICEIPFMFLSSIILTRFKTKPVILFCTVMVTVRMAVYAFIPSFAGVMVGQALHSVTFGLFYPSCVAYCARAAKSQSALVVSMSLLSVVNGVPNIIGSAAGGWIIDMLGYQALFCIFGVMPLIGVAVYMAVSRRR